MERCIVCQAAATYAFRCLVDEHRHETPLCHAHVGSVHETLEDFPEIFAPHSRILVYEGMAAPPREI